MKIKSGIKSLILGLIQMCLTVAVFGQGIDSIFLKDFQPRDFVKPLFDSSFIQSSDYPTVTVTVNASDIIAFRSKYLFGNNCDVWSGKYNDTIIRKYLRMLSPNVLGFPGGSAGDVYFWNHSADNPPKDIPDSLYNFGTKISQTWWGYGKTQNDPNMTLDDYYDLLNAINCQGIIIVNYGYARYGTGLTPALTAAHYAADWVRYDHGRTKFWQIGNESSGPWEPGYQIDPKKNHDGQPTIITGDIYGRHFKIFADSMRKAAAEIGATIYIGAQVLPSDGSSSWNPANVNWNSGFFKEAGNLSDFFIIHDYFGYGIEDPTTLFKNPVDDLTNFTTFLANDTKTNKVVNKPATLTEWNLDNSDPGLQVYHRQNSSISGIQAVIAIAEAMKNKWGLAARFLLSSGPSGSTAPPDGDNDSISDGTFNQFEPGRPWNPYPDFFYLYYMQKYFGDYMVNSSVSGNSNVISYASLFGSGDAGIIIVNGKSTSDVVHIKLNNFGYGQRYYLYTLNPGSGNGIYPLKVTVNGKQADKPRGGPIVGLDSLKAYSSVLDKEINLSLSPYSVQYIVIEKGNRYDLPTNIINLANNDNTLIYPNPSNGNFTVDIENRDVIRIEMYNLLGKKVYLQTVSPFQTKVNISSHFDHGLYVIKAFTRKDILTSKLIIE